MMSCRICGGSRLTAFEAPEMFLGTREQYVYEECATCDTLQRADVPSDLSSLYPPRYFDFLPREFPTAVVGWLRDTVAIQIHSLLDVGCANGALPAAAARMGIKTTGVDPFAPPPAAASWTVLRSLDEVVGTFDVVSASHVLEHVPDFAATLRTLVEHMSPAGRLVVMMPFACSPLASKYGSSWIGLDPGRHLHVLTRQIFEALAHDAGLEVERMEDQTTALNLAVCEAWGNGFTFTQLADRGIAPADVSRYEREAAAIRAAGRGDVWLYVLRRRTDAECDALLATRAAR